MSEGGEAEFICYVDEDGYYIGSKEDIKYLLSDPKKAYQTREESDDDDEEPDFNEVEDSIEDYDGVLDGSTEDDIVAIEANSQSHLWSILRALARDFRKQMNTVMEDQMMFVHMPCGHITVFRAFDDIPKTSLLCGCQREWVIRYRDDIL